MNNIIEYLKWRGDIEFKNSPVNEVDAALFSMFVVPDFSGVVSPEKETVSLSCAVEKYFQRPGRSGNELGILEPKNTIPMIKDLLNTLVESMIMQDIREIRLPFRRN